MNPSRLPVLLLAAALTTAAWGDPLSKRADLDFYRDAASRGLSGLAARADGRLVAGPVLTELKGTAPAQLLWNAEAAGPGRWLVGSGPEGQVYEVKADVAAGTYTSQPVIKLDDAQVYALKVLPGGGFLAGTSPKGGLVLVEGGKVVARVRLPADSVFDLADAGDGSWLVATGNPGRIYRVALKAFRAAGISTAPVENEQSLGLRGITLFGSIVDRNVRRIAHLADGSWAAGSAPHGNVYRFPAAGGTPRLLEENANAEVTDLLPQSGGEFLASIVFSGNELRATGLAAVGATKEGGGNAANPNAPQPPAPAGILAPAPEEKFLGRAILVRFPEDGFPDLLTARAGGAFYHLVQRGSIILIAGGEQGDITGFDLSAQQALNYGGSIAARLSGLSAVPGNTGQYLVVHNNAPGFAVMDFGGKAARTLESRTMDLGQPAQIGAIRLDRLKAVDFAQLKVELKVSNGSDEREGWSPWTALSSSGDGWRADGLRGRYYKLRVSLAAGTDSAQVGHAAIFYLPQNRRPQMLEFHYLTPNYGILPPAESVPSVNTTLSQVIASHDEDKDKRKDRLLAAAVFPSLGNEAAFWTVNSPTGDNLVVTFSIRREGETHWTDLAVESRENYVQFDTSHLAEGVYYSRLIAKEAAPRPESERLSASYETDELVVDHTPPDILSATAARRGDQIIITVHGKDALSLLDNLEADFNNGLHDNVEQPADGVRDGREETFIVEESAARLAGATSVELSLSDAAGNSSTRRIELK